MLNEKLRRHSGRVTPRFKGKKELLIEFGLEPQSYWDDWIDYRDGFRGCNDRKMLRNEYMFGALYFNVKRWNKKIKLLIKRRIARKQKTRYI